MTDEPILVKEPTCEISRDDLTQDFWIHIAETARETISGTTQDYVSHIIFRVSDIVSITTELMPIYSGSHLKTPRLKIKIKDTVYHVSEKTGNKVIAMFQACRVCLKVESDVRNSP